MVEFLLGFQAWAPSLLKGVYTTVMLTIVSITLAIILGIPPALARLPEGRSVSRTIATMWVELIRGTPLLLQLFYIYYVAPSLGIRLEPITAGIIGLSVNYSAYLSEVFRASIQTVGRGQWEAAEALGLHRRLVFLLIVTPQATRVALLPTGNYVISMLKDTALVSTISIGELMFRGQVIAADNFRYVEVYTILFVLYLGMSLPASYLVSRLERYAKKY